MPDYEYSKDPNFEWLCNLLNTLIPEDFKTIILEKTEIRKQNLIESQNLGINDKPVHRYFQMVSGCFFNERKISFPFKNS